jgi:hypothetical protein
MVSNIEKPHSLLEDAININGTRVIRSISSIAVPLKSKCKILIYHKTFQIEYPPPNNALTVDF